MINIIVATDKRGGIGAGGRPLWAEGLPADTRRFNQLTSKSTVVMGRHAFESFHGILPGRQNIVVSHFYQEMNGVLFAKSLKEAYAEATHDDINVIGGESIFKQAIYDADRIYLTEVDYVFDEADAFSPAVDPRMWREVSREDHPAGGGNVFNYSFVTYSRVR